MPDSVFDDSSDLVTAAVRVDGRPIPDTCIVTAIDVLHEVNRIPVARVTLADGSLVDMEFAASASKTFAPGGTIEILAGYHAQNKPIFKGLILRQNLRFDLGRSSALTLICNDEAVKATIRRSSAQFHDATDSEVIGKLLSDAGLGRDVQPTSVRRAHQIQNRASDWDFIVSRAEANGQVVIVRDGKVSVAAPKMSPARLVASFGESVSMLDLDLDATGQLGSVVSAAWDPKAQETLRAVASEPEASRQGDLGGKQLAAVLGVRDFELQSQTPMSQPELRAWADAELMRSRLARVRGTLRISGNAGIFPGEVLQLAGLGGRFNGDAYVATVRHRIAEGAWTTEVGIGLPRASFAESNLDVTALPAAGLRPGVRGLQIAKVKKVDADPEGERRVQVAMPLQTNGAEGVWVRLASPHASASAGMEFLPEIGDEVVLGFLDDDPDAGIVLGALHSSARPAPFEPDAENTRKAIVTRSQLKLSFDDDKKVVVIETPGGHVVTLSDEARSVTVTDSNANTLELAEGGITLNSPKDIVIKAGGSVAVEGKAGVTVSASADVSVKGANTSVEGEMSVSVQGGSSAELSATGETVVKGMMVLIN